MLTKFKSVKNVNTFYTDGSSQICGNMKRASVRPSTWRHTDVAECCGNSWQQRRLL